MFAFLPASPAPTSCGRWRARSTPRAITACPTAASSNSIFSRCRPRPADSIRWRSSAAAAAAAPARGRCRHPPCGRGRPGRRTDRPGADVRGAAPGRCRNCARRSWPSATSSRRWRGPRPIPARCRTTWRRRSARCGCSRPAPSGWSASPPMRCSCATHWTRRASRRSSSPAVSTSRRPTCSPRTATPMRTARPTAG